MHHDHSSPNRTHHWGVSAKPALSGCAVLMRSALPQVLFFMVLGAGVIFLSVLLYFTADIQFQRACIKVLRRLFKTVALRQACPANAQEVQDSCSYYGLTGIAIGGAVQHGCMELLWS